jgi:hypothetical protein
MLLIVGLLWPWLSKLGLGRLPGDIVIERGNGLMTSAQPARGLLTEVILAIPVEGYHHPTRLMRVNFQNPIPRD